MGALLAVFVALFFHTFLEFADGWHAEENQHGVLVPFLIAAVIWMQWPSLRKMAVDGSPALGLAVLIPTLCIHVAGVWLGFDRPIGYTFPFAIAGLCLYFLGTKLTRRLLFPLTLVFFMVPLPGGLLDIMSSPLQLISARLVVMLAGLCGIVVKNDGVNLFIPAKHLEFEVAQACSGLHSLIAMCLLAALFAYFTPVGLVYRIVIFLLAVPLAIAGNVARIMAVLLVANAHGQAAGMAFHDSDEAKLLPFIVAFVIFLAIGRGMELMLRRKTAQPASAAPA